MVEAQVLNFPANRMKRQPVLVIDQQAAAAMTLIDAVIHDAADRVGRWMIAEHPTAAYVEPTRFAGATLRLMREVLEQALEEISRRSVIRAR